MASLPGRCHGVNPLSDLHSEGLAELQPLITDWKDCRALCCNLEQRCTVWQYQNSTETCYIQKRPVRRGSEGADTALYCDPFPSHSWNGQHKGIGKASSVLPGVNGKCSWAHSIPRQCFGFGPERLINSLNKKITTDTSLPDYRRMTTLECEDACCRDTKCDSWQEFPGRGCYFGTSDCTEEASELPYDGSRKCIPGFCGGEEFEKQILSGLPSDKLDNIKSLVKWLKENPA